MRVGILGAGGRVGRRVAAFAAERGHTVVGLVRREPPPELVAVATVRAGDAHRAEDVRALLAEVDALVCAVGGRGTAVPRDTLTGTARALVEAADGPRRVVWVGTLGLLPLSDGRFRGDVTMPAALREGFLDHRAAFLLLRGSPLAWTVLCPGHMPEGPLGPYRIVLDTIPEPTGPVTVGCVADAALRCIEDPATIGRRVGIVGSAGS